MKAYELQDYLRSLNTGWVNTEETVDTFKSGDPNQDIQGIAVGWMSYSWALHQAMALGCNVFITHEPTYYTHLERDDQIFKFEGARRKKSFVEQSGLIILRCHDLWDGMRDIGICDSWGAQLGFSNPIDGEIFFRIYTVQGKTAIDVAHQVLDHTKTLGQEAVELIGPAEKKVSRVAIGTGAITPYMTLVDKYRADLVICTDDGMFYCFDGAYAIDTGTPLIVVNHAVSEEAGMKKLAQHLQAKFPHIPVHYIPQYCMYQLVT
jgi:putative NIF3 family GTP cyclohydrolase 1 type 2